MKLMDTSDAAVIGNSEKQFCFSFLSKEVIII